MTDLTLGLYVAGVIVTITIYFLYVNSVLKSEGINIFDLLGFKRFVASKVKSHDVSSSVQQQISQLEKKMYNTDDGDERRKLLDQIRKLEQQR